MSKPENVDDYRIVSKIYNKYKYCFDITID
jgi:hypothetical protein